MAEQIFLSYAKEDSDAATKVRGKLRGDGFRVWMDQHDLFPGEAWDQTIRSAIRRSRVFVVLLSENAIGKTGYIQKEIREALEVAELSPEGHVFIIPCRLQECDVPERLRRWQWVDLFRRGGYQRLRQALSAHLGPIPTSVGSKLSELTPFASPLEHYLYEVFESNDMFLYARLPKRGYALSQGHFMVIRQKMNPVFKTLKGKVSDYRRLTLEVVEKLLPPSAPWRRREFLVRKTGQLPGQHRVLLQSRAAVTAVFDYYWRGMVLVARHPEIYVSTAEEPVYIERDGVVLMVVMPMRITAEERAAVDSWAAH